MGLFKESVSSLLDASVQRKQGASRLSNTNYDQTQPCSRAAKCAHFKSAVKTPCLDCLQPISSDHIHDPEKGYRLDHACLSKRYDGELKQINYPTVNQGETLLCAHGAVCSGYSQYKVKRCDLCQSEKIDLHYHDITRNLKLCQACLTPQVLDFYLLDSSNFSLQPTTTFVSELRDQVTQHSSELNAHEVQELIDRGNLNDVVAKLWEFTGTFYAWPEALLNRRDLNQNLKENLQDNLDTELGKYDGAAHTELFATMAESLGVKLIKPAPVGGLIGGAINNAMRLGLASALGQFFANECLPKWHGFTEVLADRPDADLTFFEVHMDESEHYSALANGLPLQQRADFKAAALGYTILRAEFMDEVRRIGGVTTCNE